MKRRNLPVFVLGTIFVGLLIVRCNIPVPPNIQFVSPAGLTTIMSEQSPEDVPIPVAVEVEFPPAVQPCGGQVFPVEPSTLEVKLVPVDDGAVGTGREIDASGWWNPENDRITGQITIGEVPGESWAHYRVVVTISNAQGQASTWRDIRVEMPITEFPGGWFTFHITSLLQSPPNCLVRQFVLDAAMGLIGPIGIPVFLPASSALPASIPFPFPEPIGEIVLDADVDLDNNDIVFYPVVIDGIDLGSLGIEGFNCLVGGTADGAMDGQVSTGDLDGTIRISDMTVSIGGGQGTCTLQPSPDCKLYIRVDGDGV